MRRKVLKHYADTVCQMFCGWQNFDWDPLIQRGSGVLMIDLLTGECRHNKERMPQLSVVRVLQSWLFDRCAKDSVPTDFLKAVQLRVELNIRNDVPSDKSQVVCSLDCSSLIKTDEKDYSGTFRDEERLPGATA